MLDASPSALRAFVLVATHRSFSKAASELGTRQSTVSSQIARLEELVGQALLERSTRRVALAPAGKRLLPLAEEIVELHKIAAARVHDASLSGDVHFAVPEALWASFPLAEAIGRFGRSHPEVAVRVSIDSARNIESQSQNGDFHLSLLANPSHVGNARLVRRERLRWYGRAPDAPYGQAIALVKTPFDSAHDAIARVLKEDQLNDGAAHYSLAFDGGTLASAAQAIANGIGIGALPVTFAEEMGLTPFAGELPALPSVDVYLISKEQPGEAAAALRNQLLQRLGRASRVINDAGPSRYRASVAAKRSR